MVEAVYCWQNINGTYKVKQNIQNQKISQLCNDDKKTEHSSNPNDIFKSAKTFMKKFYTNMTTSKTATAEIFSKISNKNKISFKSTRSYKIYKYSNK